MNNSEKMLWALERKNVMGVVRQILGLEPPIPVEIRPYEEPEDEKLFRILVVTHAVRYDLEKVLLGMSKAYLELDWSA